MYCRRFITRVSVAAALLSAASAPHSAHGEAAKAALPVAAREALLAGHDDWRFTELTVDLAKAKLVAALRPPKTPGGAGLALLAPAGFVAAINGGYFDGSYDPTGWLVSDGVTVHDKNRSAKGGVVAVDGVRTYIGPMKGLPFKPTFAVQNGPLLVEEGGVLGIKSESGKRAPRTLACLGGARTDKARPLRLIVIEAGGSGGPTLLETATLLAKPLNAGGFGCSVALNLDGGPSTGIVADPRLGVKNGPPLVPIGYGIAIVPL